MKYTDLNTKILNEFITNSPTDFDSCLSSIKSFISDNFTSLGMKGNDVIQEIELLSKSELSFIIKQYSCFSQESIHMLLNALLRNHDWPLLFEEIQENIDEEKGLETKGIPHLEIMREGYRKDLGLEVDFRTLKPTLVTRRFLDDMHYIFNHDDNAFSAGALLAFEGTAIEEFHILDAIIKEYYKKTKGEQSILSNKLTNYYIDGHKLFEIGHEDHLIKAVKPYITPENIQRMVRGYLSVSITMDTWWKQLYFEAKQQNIISSLENFTTQYTEVEDIIIK